MRVARFWDESRKSTLKRSEAMGFRACTGCRGLATKSPAWRVVREAPAALAGMRPLGYSAESYRQPDVRGGGGHGPPGCRRPTHSVWRLPPWTWYDSRRPAEPPSTNVEGVWLGVDRRSARSPIVRFHRLSRALRLPSAPPVLCSSGIQGRLPGNAGAFKKHAAEN